MEGGIQGLPQSRPPLLRRSPRRSADHRPGSRWRSRCSSSQHCFDGIIASPCRLLDAKRAFDHSRDHSRNHSRRGVHAQESSARGVDGTGYPERFRKRYAGVHDSSSPRVSAARDTGRAVVHDHLRARQPCSRNEFKVVSGPAWWPRRVWVASHRDQRRDTASIPPRNVSAAA